MHFSVKLYNYEENVVLVFMKGLKSFLDFNNKTSFIMTSYLSHWYQDLGACDRIDHCGGKSSEVWLKSIVPKLLQDRTTFVQ